MFQGSYTALITPFRDGDIDYQSLEALIERQITANITGLVLCGTTGESPTLTDTEYKKVLHTSIEIIKKRVPIIIGTGSNNTAQTLEKTLYAENLEADAVLVVAPYYNKPTQEGIYEHFSRIADAVNIPLMLYNIPGRTGINISADTITRLSQKKNISSLKESSGDLGQAMHILKNTPKTFSLLSGDDILTLPLLSLGGHGLVSVLSNIFPERVVDFVQACLTGNMDLARALHYKYFELMNALFIEANPAPVKYLLSKMGLCAPELRLPLCQVAKASREVLDAVYERLIKD